MNLILLAPDELEADGSIVLRDGRARHVHDVLRASPGSEVRIGILDGPVGTGLVTAVDPQQVRLTCAFQASDPLPVPPVDLLLALPRPKVLRRLWPHLAALGVGRVMLTNAARVERNYFDSHYVSPDGFRPLLIEGLQQARDTRVPNVTVHKQFRKLIEDELDVLCPDTTRLVAHPGGVQSIRDVLTGARPPATRRVVLAVGPEGGWNDFERALMQSRGFVDVSLGPRTLATTTACIALLTLVHDAFGR